MINIIITIINTITTIIYRMNDSSPMDFQWVTRIRVTHHSSVTYLLTNNWSIQFTIYYDLTQML